MPLLQKLKILPVDVIIRQHEVPPSSCPRAGLVQGLEKNSKGEWGRPCEEAGKRPLSFANRASIRDIGFASVRVLVDDASIATRLLQSQDRRRHHVYMQTPIFGLWVQRPVAESIFLIRSQWLAAYRRRGHWLW